MKNQLAYSGNWVLQVMVDEEGNVFYRVPNSQINLPFVTDEKYQLVDASDLKSITAKYILSERKNQHLTKQVADNYNSGYLEKYFKEKVIDLPNVEMIQHIICVYSEYLRETFGSSEWYEKNQAINKQDLNHIDKDLARINLFMEFLASKRK